MNPIGMLKGRNGETLEERRGDGETGRRGENDVSQRHFPSGDGALPSPRLRVSASPLLFFPAHAVLLVAFALLLCTAQAKDSVIQCANLIYGGTHTSRCFSDEFLSAVQRQTTIPSERRFKSVKLASDELFHFPFVIMTGEADFHFTTKERENLKRYLTSGGFLLASAGCSNKDWDRAFRREMKTILPDHPLKEIPMDHLIFRTVKKIDKLNLTHGGEPARLSGIDHNGKTMVVYSPHGLNDTAHTEGCCCCGGNEIGNSLEMNVNILVYALLY